MSNEPQKSDTDLNVLGFFSALRGSLSWSGVIIARSLDSAHELDAGPMSTAGDDTDVSLEGERYYWRVSDRPMYSPCHKKYLREHDGEHKKSVTHL